jgi:outer membrane protein assembly factor BamD
MGEIQMRLLRLIVLGGQDFKVYSNDCLHARMRFFRTMINAKPFFRPRLFVVLAFGLLLSGCTGLSTVTDWLGSFGKGSEHTEDEHANWTARQLYDEAKKELMDGSYEKATHLYEKLEARYPFGALATQAQLEIGYAYYKNSEWDSALAAVDRFIKLNPVHEGVDYAYYLRGLINYNKGKNFVDRFLPTDSSQRDPGASRESLKDFNALLVKFPNSKYARDSKLRIIALRNNLAMYEVHVADYYMRRGAYVATVRRCTEVVEKYPRTQAIPQALQLMEEAYRKLEMNDLANDTARVYALNYGPGAKTQTLEKEYEATPAEQAWDFIGFDR